MTQLAQLRDLLSSLAFATWLKCIQLSKAWFTLEHINAPLVLFDIQT